MEVHSLMMHLHFIFGVFFASMQGHDVPCPIILTE